MKVNNIENPCAICGKPTKSLKQVSCKELGNVHGDDCKCYLDVGSGCYRKLKQGVTKNDRAI